MLFMHIARSDGALKFEANVTKCVVVDFRSERTFDGEWFWGDSALPHLDYYNYL